MHNIDAWVSELSCTESANQMDICGSQKALRIYLVDLDSFFFFSDDMKKCLMKGHICFF